MNLTDTGTAFSLSGSFSGMPFPRLKRALEGGFERLFALENLNEIYRKLGPARDPAHFISLVLGALNVDYEVPPGDLDLIPASGPAIVVANHPFGAIEGVLLAHLLRTVRPDVRIMANYMLERIPELAGLFIAVDPFGGEGAARRNMRPLREAVSWVRGGGLLLVFPAGTVSHLHVGRGCVTDPSWNPNIGRLVTITQAPVVPVYFHGTNSRMFQLAGLVHPRLRTALLPRELLKRAHTTLALRIGRPIPYAHLKTHVSEHDLTQYLRMRTYVLAERFSAKRVPPDCGPKVSGTPVMHPVPAGLLIAEVEALPDEQRLAGCGRWQVVYARAAQIPWCLQEIGRLRESSFREAGEGTGRATDIDLFDAYYVHLFVWDAEHACVVGAYRLGLVDDILARYGKRGLYTYSLFKYGRQVLDKVNPGIELGRSFVRAEYHKDFAPLMMLWKGIGEFVRRHPRYAILFGPVSISNSYQETSRYLLVDYLRANNVEKHLARYVKPRHPFRGRRPVVLNQANLSGVKSIEDLSRLVAEIEHDSKGVPVLLKQYLRLGGRILGFNEDARFSEALDGLIMVDLRCTDPQTLARYMGQAGAASFLAVHRSSADDLRIAS